MLRNFTNRRLFIFATCVIAISATGCRSGKMNGMNLFGMGGEPSAESLAGNGPTVTYPTPPGDSATPEAIASIAGGTIAPTTSPATNPTGPQTSLAGYDAKPSYVTPAGMDGVNGPNMAAAAANGLYGGTQPAGFASPNINTPQIKTPPLTTPNVTAPSMPTGGYQFGTNPPATPATNPGSATNAGYTVPSTYQPPSAVAPSSYAGDTGLTLPTDVTSAMTGNVSATKEMFTPKVADASFSMSDSPSTSMSLPAMPTSVDSNMPTVSLPESSMPSMNAPTSSMPNSSIPTTSQGSYSPGSTSGASGYPSSGSASGGSTFR